MRPLPLRSRPALPLRLRLRARPVLCCAVRCCVRGLCRARRRRQWCTRLLTDAVRLTDTALAAAAPFHSPPSPASRRRRRGQPCGAPTPCGRGEGRPSEGRGQRLAESSFVVFWHFLFFLSFCSDSCTVHMACLFELCRQRFFVCGAPLALTLLCVRSTDQSRHFLSSVNPIGTLHSAFLSIFLWLLPFWCSLWARSLSLSLSLCFRW